MFFRIAEAFKTCFGLIFTFEPSVDSLYLYLFIYIFIYLHYMMIIRSWLPRHWGLFVVQRSRLPVFFPARRRAARVCARVASGLDVWRGQQSSMLLMCIYIHMCVCVLDMLSVYTMLYIYIFCIIEYYKYICCIWSNICIKYIEINYNTYYIYIYYIPSTRGLGWVPLQDSCMTGLFYVHTQSRPCNMRHPRP